MVRRFVEALFITHTETKLNTSGQLLNQNNNDDDANNNNNNNHGNINSISSEAQIKDRQEWCRDLVIISR
jgi:hypothetical protein